MCVGNFVNTAIQEKRTDMSHLDLFSFYDPLCVYILRHTSLHLDAL